MFSRSILEGKASEPSGEEGLADVRIVQAIFASAERGRVIELAPFSRAQRPTLSQEMHKPSVEHPDTIRAPSPSTG